MQVNRAYLLCVFLSLMDLGVFHCLRSFPFLLLEPFNRGSAHMHATQAIKRQIHWHLRHLQLLAYATLGLHRLTVGVHFVLGLDILLGAI